MYTTGCYAVTCPSHVDVALACMEAGGIGGSTAYLPCRRCWDTVYWAGRTSGNSKEDLGYPHYRQKQAKEDNHLPWLWSSPGLLLENLCLCESPIGHQSVNMYMAPTVWLHGFHNSSDNLGGNSCSSYFGSYWTLSTQNPGNFAPNLAVVFPIKIN